MTAFPILGHVPHVGILDIFYRESIWLMPLGQGGLSSDIWVYGKVGYLYNGEMSGSCLRMTKSF